MHKNLNMIQRVQTLYLFLVLVSLIMVTIGTDIFVTTVEKEETFTLTTHANVYGVQRDISIDGELNQKEAEFIKALIEKIGLRLDKIFSFYFC